MKTLDIKTLLPELKKLVTDLSDDMLKRVNDNAEINDGLKHAYQQIEKGGRTAQAYEVWLEDYLDQVAVAWVLACVFVRFMEDNGLIDECWLAGEGQRRKRAEDAHTLFFRDHPHDSDREYFEHVFREVGKIAAAADLFAEGKTPLWAVGPTGDGARNLLKFWREIDTDEGHLKRPFVVENGDTRFLGDLYQELSERAKKKYALLQTPVFVEEFILDRTLTPALDEFGLETVRMIDPTCGSGHFLLGGFARLFKLWSQPEYTTGSAEKDAQKALDGVWGVDLNPFAVAIARFRLIAAAVQACGITRLRKAPGWTIHLATGDSLLFGSRWTGDGHKKAEQQFLGTKEESWAPEIYACEDKEALSDVLGQQYHAVVGNPPYIIMRDRNLNTAYRSRYSTCYQKYSLGVPFTERFFDLALDGGGGRAGYIGMITTNSFMKREFGKKLIEEFFPHVDLTHVIDTSGAYIPGHGTPTVILFGRNRRPTGDTVRAVFGIRGEPSTPEDASEGEVWQSILRHIDKAGSQDAFTSTADVARSTFNTHPWSTGGGGAAQLKERLDSSASTTLQSLIRDIGFMAISGEDDAFVAPLHVLQRNGVTSREFCIGEGLRDWVLEPEGCIVFPYDESASSLDVLAAHKAVPLLKFVWPSRTVLRNRNMFGKTPEEHGLAWFEYMQFIRYRAAARQCIAFAFVASHSHFVFDRGGRVFNRSAPIIMLPAEASEDDHLALLGLFNSSIGCFWLKQVSHQKQLTGGDGVRVESRAQVPYEFAGTQIQHLPIPQGFRSGVLRERLLRLTREMDRLGREMGSLSAHKAISEGLSGGETLIREKFANVVEERNRIRFQMVFLQEELDFTCYCIFGLADEPLLCENWRWSGVKVDAGHRPFEILQQRNIDRFSVPTETPADWPEELKELWRKRIEAIRKDADISLIEDDHYKRRWIGRQGLFNHAARQNELRIACKNWLLDRLESHRYWPASEKHAPTLQTTAQLTDKASHDEEFHQVAALYRGRTDFDLSALVSELVEGESVPFLPILRYKAAGLRKRAVWERTWELQRREDAGEDVGDVPVPPKYTTTDFQKTDYWRLRGKLDVPKERWISYQHCERDGDPSLVVGWAGWNHLQHATALVAYYDARKREGWTAERLKPILAGLDQLLPWIHQWHPEVDPEYGETAGQSFQNLLESDSHELGLTLDEIRSWTPPKKTNRRKRSKA